MSKHTPGPWHLDIEMYDDEHGTICVREINRLLHDPDWADSEDWDRDLANGRLIAAAPDLYDIATHIDRFISVALEKYPLSIELDEELIGMRERVRAAIAKVEKR